MNRAERRKKKENRSAESVSLWSEEEKKKECLTHVRKSCQTARENLREEAAGSRAIVVTVLRGDTLLQLCRARTTFRDENRPSSLSRRRRGQFWGGTQTLPHYRCGRPTTIRWIDRYEVMNGWMNDEWIGFLCCFWVKYLSHLNSCWRIAMEFGTWTFMPSSGWTHFVMLRLFWLTSSSGQIINLSNSFVHDTLIQTAKCDHDETRNERSVKRR